ncbi:unnamed protein product, partial [Amoebophrya sp. A120]
WPRTSLPAAAPFFIPGRRGCRWCAQHRRRGQQHAGRGRPARLRCLPQTNTQWEKDFLKPERQQAGRKHEARGKNRGRARIHYTTDAGPPGVLAWPRRRRAGPQGEVPPRAARSVAGPPDVIPSSAPAEGAGAHSGRTRWALALIRSGGPERRTGRRACSLRWLPTRCGRPRGQRGNGGEALAGAVPGCAEAARRFLCARAPPHLACVAPMLRTPSLWALCCFLSTLRACLGASTQSEAPSSLTLLRVAAIREYAAQVADFR